MLFRNKLILIIVIIAFLIGVFLFFQPYFTEGEVINVFPDKTAPPEPSVSFIVGGDMMFARMINYQFNDDFTQAVSGLKGVFDGYDAKIINLEGAITTKPIPDVRSNTFTFWFSPKIIDALDYLGINGASMANNHSDNAGAEGLETTRTVLTEAGIQPFGGPRENDVVRVAKFQGQGLTLAVVGINLTYPGQRAESAVSVIQELEKEPDTRIIVYPHWGTEYLAGHTAQQAAAARVWIDAGADLIIGAHPHVIEDAEIYKGVPIIYSLGNLLFDQNFSLATRESLIIEGKFTESGVEISGIPTLSIQNKPGLMTGERKEEIINTLCSQIICRGAEI